MTKQDPSETLLASEFSLQPPWIYLNHAAVAPWPRRTSEAVKHFAEENRDYGASHYEAWLATERATREQIATLIKAPADDDIAFVKNTSEALSIVAHGFPWQAGDNVVISDEEFPSNRIVWESLARYAVQVREVNLKTHDPEQALLDAADNRTRLLSISSVQYASGLRLDLARLGAGCRAQSIAFCVDAIQSLGAVDHDVQACHIDFLMADAHKWLLGPEGIGVFYCSAEWRERLLLHEYGWRMVQHPGDFDRREWQVDPSARRFECGSPNMLGIHALAASLSLLLEIGMPQVERLVLARAEHLMAAIEASPALELVTRRDPGRYAGIVSFRHRHMPSAALYEVMRRQHVVCALRADAVRLSPHCHTPLSQLDQALAVASDAGP